MIDERDDHFHCYGCRAHGDVISWVMRREGPLHGGLRSPGRATRTAAASLAAAPASTSDRTRRWDRLTLAEQVVMNMAGAVYHHTSGESPERWPTSAIARSRIG